MTEQLISFETAKLAKKKGFNELCREGYNYRVVLNDVHFLLWKFFTKNSEIDDANEELKIIRSRLYPEEIFNPDFICVAPTQSLL